MDGSAGGPLCLTRISRAGRMGSPFVIPGSDDVIDSYAVAINGNDLVVATWAIVPASVDCEKGCSEIEMATTWRLGKAVSPAQVVSSADVDAGPLALGVSKRGTAIVMWSTFGGELQSAVSDRGGSFHYGRKFSTLTSESSLVFDDRDRPIVSWASSDPLDSSRLLFYAALGSTSGRLGRAHLTGRISGQDAPIRPTILTDGMGAQTASWITGGAGNSSIYAAFRSSRKSFGHTQLVGNSRANELISPAEAEGRDGTTVLAWTASSRRGTYLEAATALPGQRFGRPMRVAGPNVDSASSPQVGVDAAGRAVLVFGQKLHSGTSDVVAVTVNSDSRFGNRNILSHRPQGYVACGAPSLTMGPGGDAVASWSCTKNHEIVSAEALTQYARFSPFHRAKD
jgi:hypothetical protein